jgi:ATP-dependent Lon protease
MNEKCVEQSVKIKFNNNNDDKTHIIGLIKNKIDYICDIIRNSVISSNEYKRLNVYRNIDLQMCYSSLNELYNSNKNLLSKIYTSPVDECIEQLQKIIDRLSLLMTNLGTKSMEDLLYITFGSEFKQVKNNPVLNAKLELIRKHFHPIGFKIMNDKKKYIEKKESYCIDKMTDESIQLEKSQNLECFEYDINKNSFLFNIRSSNIVFRSETNKTMIVSGYFDDLYLNFFDNEYISHRTDEIYKRTVCEIDADVNLIKRQHQSFSLRDILIYGNEDMVKKYKTILNQAKNIKSDRIESSIKRFTEIKMESQRNMLINLLIYNKDEEIQYMTYLLYDLITIGPSNEMNEQMIIYESFPPNVKEYFKDAMKHTLNYTQKMNDMYDNSKVKLEHQIYTLKVPDNVKEKAMIKLKEIKGKSDESGAKAKQYLEGLLKIPFNNYREEPILRATKELNAVFQRSLHQTKKVKLLTDIEQKDNYTNLEMMRYATTINNEIETIFNKKTYLSNLNEKKINAIFKYLKKNKLIELTTPAFNKLNDIHRKKIITKAINSCSQREMVSINSSINKNESHYEKIYSDNLMIKNEIECFGNEIKGIENALDESVYGHTHAKNQIMKIIGQWITGEQNGYCFGFEGSPGVGKTSLAKKGLSNCLTDTDGTKRPFSFIALGGSCNGSTLEGHGFTYVNSSWGRIADILMDSRCMNPIIYIDELDKVSKSEHGKEIIGILTHLIDYTQNDGFQDKYFSGIDIDLSRALIIFSYNDPSQIDRILLDRIHRIKFDNLTTNEKIVIANKYIIPEINKKMGFSNIVELSEDIITNIINLYTNEPGVRKLKEILFDLYGEVNIELLKTNSDIEKFPLKITMENIENKYLKRYCKIREKMVHTDNASGIINGLWANVLGKGGIIPIEVSFCPSNTILDLKLTGMQGDVMKESMNVSKTVAWNLTDNKIKSKLYKEHEENKSKGIHIHCPDGAVSKDGPSAGTAITLAIYSVLNNLKIRCDVAITGEIDLIGNVTAIGGLEDKILGGVRAGVKKFIFPKENETEYNKFCEKNSPYSEIEFIMVENVKDTFKHIFV